MLPSKILLKLVDFAVVPAFLSSATKIISGLWLLRLLNIPFSFSKADGLPSIIFESTADFLRVNALSDLIVLIVLSLILVTLLTRSLFFHDTHLSPTTMVKLFDLKLTKIVGSSFELFGQGLIWLSILWLFTFSLFLSYLWQAINLAVLATSFTLCILLTFAFILDIERELKT